MDVLMRHVVPASFFLMLASCFNPIIGDATITCGAGEACPEGFECWEDNLCHEMGAPGIDSSLQDATADASVDVEERFDASIDASIDGGDDVVDADTSDGEDMDSSLPDGAADGSVEDGAIPDAFHPDATPGDVVPHTILGTYGGGGFTNDTSGGKSFISVGQSAQGETSAEGVSIEWGLLPLTKIEVTSSKTGKRR